MNEDRLPTNVSHTMVINVPGDGQTSACTAADETGSVQPNQGVNIDGEHGWDTTGAHIGGAATTYQPRRISTTKNRRKSRKLTQVCAEEVANTLNSPNQPEPVPMREKERLHVSPSLMSFDSVSSKSSISGGSTTTSSYKPNPHNKINRIFSMLQKMQHSFIQTYYQQDQQQQQDQQDQFKSGAASDSASNNSVVVQEVGNASRRPHLQLPLDLTNQTSTTSSTLSRLYNLGRSQDSLMSAGSMLKINKLRNSWAGSQCSGFTSTTPMSEGPAPPLVHAMPYHKDGW